MNIIYIGAFPPNFLVERSKGKIDSLYRDDQAIIRGLYCQDDVSLSVITSPDIASWPKGPFLVQRERDDVEGITIVSSLNVSLLKQPWTIVSMLREANRLIKRYDEKVIIIVPYLVFRHVFVLRLLKWLHPRKVVQAIIVPDIFFPSNRLLKRVNRFTEQVTAKFDAFVLYTKKMAEHLQVKEGHYEVIEGFREVPEHKLLLNNDFKIVYAGSLNLNYGVGRLLDALSLIDDTNVQLHLYGDGSAVPKIIELSEKDNRLFYHGKVPNAEAVEAIYSASVLINPRNAYDGEYTEYSFPSKDIEYMATGIPTLLCKLPGMPEQYYNYFIDMGEGTPAQIATAIKRVMAMSIDERNALGAEAKQFIKDRMDCKKQGERIVALFNRVITN